MRSRLLAALTLVALLAGCVAAAAPAPGGTPATSADPAADQVGLALAAFRDAVAGPSDGAALRQALDQVELALALAPTSPGQRAELISAEQDLLARLERLEGSEAPDQTAIAVSPPPEAAPPAAAATTPPATPPAATEAAGAQPQPTASATASLAAPTFTLAGRKSFEGSGESGQFASCIDVQILGRGGPVAGAVIGINNGDHGYQDQTDQSGYAGRCGLGASTWSVVLFWTPEGGQAQGVTTTVYVSGAPEQRAAVVLQER